MNDSSTPPTSSDTSERESSGPFRNLRRFLVLTE